MIVLLGTLMYDIAWDSEARVINIETDIYLICTNRSQTILRNVYLGNPVGLKSGFSQYNENIIIL